MPDTINKNICIEFSAVNRVTSDDRPSEILAIIDAR